METQFYILLSLKTPKGFVDYGQYCLGDDRNVAHALFKQLKGSSTLHNWGVLHIDLMETGDQLPVTVNSICCTLEDLGYNCKLIARELFRLKNLEEIAT